MAEVTSRLELKEYCLRRLGFPVIDINVADTQLEDRIDDSIQYFNEWHYDGCEKLYMKQQLNASKLFFVAPVTIDSFKRGDNIVGQTSGAKALVFQQTTTGYVEVWQIEGAFVASETVTVSSSGATGALAATNFITLGILDTHYIDIPHQVMSVVKIFQMSSVSASNYLFDPMYYHVYDMIWNFGGMDLISYEMMRQRLNQINNTFTGQKPLRFNRRQERLYIDLDWKKQVFPNVYVIIECYRVLDPSTYTSVWDDYFLKAYTTELFRIQWGENLSKFSSIQLPGGVVLDGPRILTEGKDAKEKLEEQMKSGRWSEPVSFIVG
jgi:hypothetical protein